MNTSIGAKRQLEDGPGSVSGEDEDLEAKKRRVLEETRAIDAASDSDDESSDQDSEDEEDETAELLRELEKIKRERAEKKEQEERETAVQEQEQRESDIAYGNPLLNPNRETETRRRWDDDVVFRNQARGTEKKSRREFVNDLLRSDFHKRFMVGLSAATLILATLLIFHREDISGESRRRSIQWVHKILKQREMLAPIPAY